MGKTKLSTIFILIITIGLLIVVGYFSYILNKKGDTSVTQIKKTKASAQTYHKLLALNVTPVQKDVVSSNSVTDENDENKDEVLDSPTPILTNPISSPKPTLISLVSTPIPTSTKIPSPTLVLPTQETMKEDGYENATEPEVLVPTKIPTPTTPLLAYRTISPTLLPVRDTGTEITNKPTLIPTKKVLSKDVLPESGWGIQQSIILFIVAATTIFLSFLF